MGRAWEGVIAIYEAVSSHTGSQQISKTVTDLILGISSAEHLPLRWKFSVES
jgi:hypothetical protein